MIGAGFKSGQDETFQQQLALPGICFHDLHHHSVSVQATGPATT